MNAAMGPGHAAGHRAHVLFDVFVGVPVATGEAVVGAAPDLHEPHAALEHAPRHQAVQAHLARLGHCPFRRSLCTCCRLIGDIQHLRGADLKMGRQLVAADPRFQARIIGAAGAVIAIELLQQSPA